MISIASRQGLTIVAYDTDASPVSQLQMRLDEQAQADLRTACLHDLLASVMRLSGVSFTVAAPNAVAGQELHQTLPAGVNVIVCDTADDPVERDRCIFTEARGRGVERTVILAGDALAVPTATAGTAFGVLESADIVIGSTRSGERYLVGAGTEASIATILAAGSDPADVLRLAAKRGLVARRLEPHSRLTSINGLDELQGVPGLGPRVTAWLAARDIG